jgi:hypothetical protein
MLCLNDGLVWEADDFVGRVVVAVPNDNSVPRDRIKLASSKVLGFDHPSLAAEWSKHVEIGFLAKNELDG